MRTVGARTRVVVVDRRTMIREGLSSVLRAASEIEVVAAVGRFVDIDDVREPFDVIVTNLSPHEVNRADGVPVTTYDDTQGVDVLLEALSVEPPAASTHSDSSVGDTLTRRERQVMRGIADGLSSVEIAACLEIAPKSVDNHKQRIFAKLQVRSQTHAVTVSLANGLLAAAPRVGCGSVPTVPSPDR